MSKKIIVTFMLLIFFGCNEKTSKIEVIPNYNNVYLNESMVTEKAKPIDTNFSKDMIKSFKQTLKQLLSEENIKEKVFILDYVLYINEKGKVDKIKEEGSINEKGIFILYDYNKKFTELILPVIEKWSFIPAKLNGEPVKSKKTIRANFLLKDGKLVETNYENTYFVSVEQMPEPIEGFYAIQKRIKYTKAAIRSGIEGKIYVLAYINSKGIVTKAKIIKGLGYGLDESALKAVKATKFKPGKRKGKPVNVQVSIPIVFSLRN